MFRPPATPPAVDEAVDEVHVARVSRVTPPSFEIQNVMFALQVPVVPNRIHMSVWCGPPIRKMPQSPVVELTVQSVVISRFADAS
jgi:hypothetical protein